MNSQNNKRRLANNTQRKFQAYGLGTLLLLILSITVQGQNILAQYSSSNSQLPTERINCISTLGDTIWVGTEVGIYQLLAEQWTIISTSNSDLADDRIKSLYSDSSGLWVGTLSEGLLHKQGEQWTNYNTGNSSIPSNFIRTITASPDWGVCVGTNNGLAILKNGEWTVIEQLTEGAFLNTIASIQIENMDRIWLGSLNAGLFKLDNGGLQQYENLSSDIPDNTIVDIAIDAENNKWLSTPSNGLAIFDDFNFETVDPNISNFNSIEGVAVEIDEFGRIIWATRDQGVAVIDGSTSILIDSLRGLNENKITSIALQDSILWIGMNTLGLAKVLLESPTGITGDLRQHQTIIWPNPCASVLHLGTNFSIEKEVLIFDSQGRLVYDKMLSTSESSIDVSSLRPGIHLLKVGKVCVKFTKL